MIRRFASVNAAATSSAGEPPPRCRSISAGGRRSGRGSSPTQAIDPVRAIRSSRASAACTAGDGTATWRRRERRLRRDHRHVPLRVLKPAEVSADDLWSPRNAAPPGDPVTPTSPTPTPITDRRRRSRSDRKGDERGAALVEFALIALPVFTILFGTIEFGWLMFQYHDIRHGARDRKSTRLNSSH